MDVPFAEVATTLGRSEDAVKALASRARVHVREPRVRKMDELANGLRLRERFAATIFAGDLALVNGMPGFVFSDSGGVFQTTALEIRDDRIVAVYITRNPDKLARVTEKCR